MLTRIFIFILLMQFSVSISAQTPPTLVPVIDSLEKKLSASDNDSNRVITLMDLLNTYIDFDLAKAADYGLQAYTQSKKIGYLFGEGRSLYSLASISRSKGNYQQADSFYIEAEKIFTSLKRDDRLAMIVNERGNLYFMQGNYWLAGDYYTKATNLFEKQKDTIKTIISYQNLIAVLGETQNYTRAIELAQIVLPLAKKTSDTSQVFYILQSLLTNYTNIDKLDSAALYIQPLINFSNTPDYYIAADIFNALGAYYEKKNQNKEALFYFKKAIEKARQIDNLFMIANMLKSMGAVYFKDSKQDSALYYYNEAMVVAKNSENKRILFETTRLLSELYAAKGNMPEAYRYLAKHLVLKDSVMGVKVSNHVNYLEAKFESNKKEKLIDELELKNTQKQLVVEKRNKLLLIGGVTAASLLLILGLLYRSSKQKQTIAEKDQKIKEEQIKFLERQQQIVSLQSMVNGQETERTRIAKDLHDGLGGLFSTIKMLFSTLQHERKELQQDPLFVKSYDMVNTASEEVRRIAHNMMPEVLIKLGLVQATKELCNSISAGKLLQASVQVYGMEKRLNASTEIMLFRILQELLNNIIKHANATKTLIQFNRDGNRLSVTVEDNGRGFTLQETDEQAHTGISSVQNRVTYLNGKISIDSQSEIGTTVMMDFLIN